MSVHGKITENHRPCSSEMDLGQFQGDVAQGPSTPLHSSSLTEASPSPCCSSRLHGERGAEAGQIWEFTHAEDAPASYRHPRLPEESCDSIPTVEQQPGSFPHSDVPLRKGAWDAQRVLEIWRWEPLGNELCPPLTATFSKKIGLSVLIKKKKKRNKGKRSMCLCAQI